MLISCPECNNSISDKSAYCIHCGYPINSPQQLPTLVKAEPKKAVKRAIRLPNKSGSVRHLTGNRRRPWGAYPPVSGYKDNGTAIMPKAIGYYETRKEALSALMEYNKKPYDILSRQMTFTEVYNAYFEDKFELAKKTYSKASVNAVKNGYRNSEALYDRVFSELRTADFQKVLNESNLKHAGLELIHSLFKNMSLYALRNDIIDKDYAQFAQIPIPDDDENGEPFYRNEIDILWQHSDDPVVKIILVLIYSGYRLSAFETIKVNTEEMYFQGGVKTKSGKDRIVPIHSKIAPFVTEETFKDFRAVHFRDKVFKKKLAELGLDKSASGKIHTPHDCRHTFAWLCDTSGVDDLSKHILMGHAIKGDVSTKVYGHRTLENLREQIEKLV